MRVYAVMMGSRAVDSLWQWVDLAIDRQRKLAAKYTREDDVSFAVFSMELNNPVEDWGEKWERVTEYLP